MARGNMLKLFDGVFVAQKLRYLQWLDTHPNHRAQWLEDGRVIRLNTQKPTHFEISGREGRIRIPVVLMTDFHLIPLLTSSNKPDKMYMPSAAGRRFLKYYARKLTTEHGHGAAVS